MKAIQIVIDKELLGRVDHSARRLELSRSAAIRRLLELGLEQEALAALSRAEARAYARKPVTSEERAGLRALERSQQRVLDDLARKERW